MENKQDQYFENWRGEIQSSIMGSNTVAIAIFNVNGDLLFANSAVKTLFGELEPSKSLLNPTFERLASTQKEEALIYKGYLTFGDYSSVNSSIMSEIYKKGDHILITGGVDAGQLMHQNIMMHNLNREINNLQRQLIKEKHSLEITLNQLNEVNRELNLANATKDKFFSIIAHDLKNPFNSLIGFSDLLLENISMMDSKSVTDMISYINNTSKSTFLLLEDLLLWSKSQLGRLSFNPQTVLFTDLWGDISESLSLMAVKKGINLDLNIECNSTVYCDKDMIKTVLRNLVTNAIKFSHENTHVGINAHCSQSITTVEVKDSGVGIEPSRIDTIWQIGGKNSTPGTNNESGSGLGLVLCKEFIDLHNGQIWAESTLNQGSSFFFTLPKKQFD